MAFARSKWWSFFTAPLFPLLGVLLVSAPLAALGLLLKFGLGTVLAGLLWPLVLAAGVLMALLVVGLYVGWPLMWSTVSAEGTDAFDAISRTYSYVYQRPLHYFFYIVVAVLIGSLAWIVVIVFAAATLGLAHWALSWGSGNSDLTNLLSPIKEHSGIEAAGASIIYFFEALVPVFATAFLSSFFWTAAVAIYFLMRQNVDATERDEVFLPDEDEEHGLPAGGPEVAGSHSGG